MDKKEIMEIADKFNKAYYKVCSANITSGWAKGRLKELSDMLDKDEPHINFPPTIDWIKQKIDKTKDGITINQTELETLDKIFKELLNEVKCRNSSHA